jgi:uncharacterized membrane protein YphA (DoxX/SURF4 family)
MRSKAVIVARVLLGLVFFVFGLNGFLHWFPLPTMKGAAAEFMGANGRLACSILGATPYALAQ